MEVIISRDDKVLWLGGLSVALIEVALVRVRKLQGPEAAATMGGKLLTSRPGKKCDWNCKEHCQMSHLRSSWL
jgi:hypothetical protein